MDTCEEKILIDNLKNTFYFPAQEEDSFTDMVEILYQLKKSFFQLQLDYMKEEIISEKSIELFQNYFKGLINQMNQFFGDSSSMTEERKSIIGRWIQQEFLPYIMMTSNGYRWYAKPRGYAGDYLTIELMYKNESTGMNKIGKILDRCFLDVPASIAVKNRRKLLANHILKIINTNKNETPHITSLACGPATEIFDVYGQLEDQSKLNVTLIDVDEQAILYVKDKIAKMNLEKFIDIHTCNLIPLVKGRKAINLQKQDLIYSIGLIDYFKDKFVIELIDYSYSKLKANGKLILGNFHPRNSTKALMDYIFEWRLIHRDENEMNSLFIQSKFNKKCSHFYYEDQRINLFAECVK